MKKRIKDWDELLTYEKVFRILTMFFAVLTIVFVIVGETLEMDSMPFVELCMGLMFLCQAIHTWRKQRDIAILGLCTSAFIIIVVIIVTFL